MVAPTSDATAEVVLVSMPWAPPFEPALGLAILKASLTRASISSTVLHAAPNLLQFCSLETYELLASLWGVNDFLFSAVLDPELDDVQEAALDRIIERQIRGGKRLPRYPDESSLRSLLLAFRNEVGPRFLRECAERILASRPKLVALTCLFDQTIASVALAKVLKDRDPALPVALGGYALEGTPGVTIAKSFPFIDLVVSGDGEDVIVDIARKAIRGVPIRPLHPRWVLTAPKTDLTKSPTPDYSDWFLDVARLAAEHHIEIRTAVLPVESSRGCWWGQTKHCVFCGIDEETLRFRHKPATQTLAMLREIRDRHGDFVFRFSDYIMPKSFYEDLLPLLAREEPAFRLHSEIKANQPPERVELLANAGFHELQPGIESFSTPVLRAMDKGVRAIDNVSLLKAGYVNRIVINYNILYGLPSDDLESYLDMLQAIPTLYHLTPPASRTETVITRFAPLQATPTRFGLGPFAPHNACYDMLFSKQFLMDSGFDLDSYAYYFQRTFAFSPQLELVYAQLRQQVDHWRALHRERFVELSYEIEDGRARLRDTRFAEHDAFELTRDASAVLLACDARPVNTVRVARELGLDDAAMHAAVEELTKYRVVWREKDLLLGLAVPHDVSDAHAASGWCRDWRQVYC
jgi:ribosomal peptide maturation radical SAM protein 1